MARQGITTGSIPNDGTGDTLLSGAIKINENFSEVYGLIGDGTNAYVGIVTQIVAGSNISISTSYGSVTVTSTASGGAGSTTFLGLTDTPGTFTASKYLAVNSGATAIEFVDAPSGGGGGESYWTQTDVGIHTLSNVGVGTTNPTSALTVKGSTSLETLSVSGVSTFNGAIDANSTANFQGDVTLQSNLILGDNDEIQLGTASGGGDLLITHLSSTNNSLIRNKNTSGSFIIDTATGSPIEIRHSSGGEPMGIFTPNGSVSLYYDNSNKFETLGAGVTVTGTTFTNQLSVSGVSTLSSNVSVGGTISVDGGVTLATNNGTIVGTSGTAGEIKQIAGAPFYYDGSAWREFVLSSGTPVTQPADTEWDNVIFRATFDDDFTDAKFGVSPVFVSAGSSIVGSAVKIGTGSYRNIGGNVSGIGVSYAYRSDYDFTGSWTIEFWMYHDSTPTTLESIVSQVSTDDTSGNWSFAIYNTGSNIRYQWDNDNGSTKTLNLVATATWNVNYRNTWTHYALVREGDNGSIHFYVNGTETAYTINDAVIDNNILHISGAGLGFGAAFGSSVPSINGASYNNTYSLDAYFDDVRISAGVGTAGQRYNSIGVSTYATFTPPTTALPTSGTLTSVVNPPGDKYGEITLGGSPSWRGTSGVTVSQQSSGNYRVSFASTYTNSNDYFVLSHPMDQGFASYVGIARSTSHVDFSINKQSDDSAVDTGSLAVQIKNHP